MKLSFWIELLALLIHGFLLLSVVLLIDGFCTWNFGLKRSLDLEEDYFFEKENPEDIKKKGRRKIMAGAILLEINIILLITLLNNIKINI